MTPETPLQITLRDPLSEVTRKERRMLLGIGVLAVFVAKTGLIPSKISALGVDLEKSNQQAFLIVLAAVVSYFVLAFTIYGLADFLAWRLTYGRAIAAAGEEWHDRAKNRMSSSTNSPPTFYPNTLMSRSIPYLATSVSLLRALFEFLLPVLVGAYAIFALLSAVK